MEFPQALSNVYNLIGIYILFSVALSLIQKYTATVPNLTPSIFDYAFNKSRSALQLTSDAYRKFSKNGRLFRYHVAYVTPVSAIPEYRRQGNSVLSLGSAINDTIHLKHYLGEDNTDVVEFTIKDVTRNIPGLIPAIQDEVKRFWHETFPPAGSGSDWFEQGAYRLILAGVGRVATRMLAGRRYAANPEFTETAAAFANGVGPQSAIFFFTPKILIPYLSQITPTMKRVNKLKDIIKYDVYEYIDRPPPSDDSGEEPVLIRYLTKYVQARPAYQGANKEKILKGTIGRFMGLIFAAIDTTTLTTTHTIFDLVSHSRDEYAVPIKKQMDEVLEKHGGVWTQQALNDLTLLDSFIKESQRLHPMSLLFGVRKVMKPGGYVFTSPTGAGTEPRLHVPQGALTMLPVYGIHSDPSVYPDPDIFKGFRYIKEPGAASVPTDQFLSFGHGRHVCPGRQLALCVVKLMVIELLSTYEWKEIERPADSYRGPSISPNQTAKLTMRRIDLVKDASHVAVGSTPILAQ